MPGMTCAELRRAARDVALRQAPRAVVEAASRHCASCAACADRLWEERRLSALLAAVSATAPLPGRHVEAALLTSLRSTRVVLQQPRWRVRERLARAGGAVLAAGLVIALAVSLTRPHTAAPAPTNEREAPRSEPTSTPPVVAASRPARAPVQPAARPRPAARSKRRSEPAVTGFIPLFYGDQRPVDGPVVRIELPREAIGAFGGAFTPVQSGGTIQADVLIGDDGLARAVRVVQ